MKWWIQSRTIQPPTVTRELHQLDGLTRSAESIRYGILSLEWWISPNGRLREWLRRNAFIALWLGIPAGLVMPVVSFILYRVLEWTEMINRITRHLILLPILGLLVVLVLAVVIGLLKAILR